MSNYKPNFPYTTPAYILKPIKKTVKGVDVTTYQDISEGMLIYCSFKTFGGTETEKNGVIAVLDTANIETWYNPEIASDCGFCLAGQPKKIYKIIGEPENIDMRNQYLKFKVEAISGGA